MRISSRFRRDRLPPPGVFFGNEIGKLSRPSRGWAQGNCPFHESRSKKSFSINLDSGAFFCHGCGVKGGDIIAFIQKRDGLAFKDACKKLGVWDDAAKPTILQKIVVGRDLVFGFSVDGVQHSVRIKDDPKDWLELLRRIYRRVSDRLSELQRGDAERFDSEAENCWSIMADSLDQIRTAEEVAN